MVFHPSTPCKLVVEPLNHPSEKSIKSASSNWIISQGLGFFSWHTFENHHLAYKKWGPGWMPNVTWFSHSHRILIKKELTISHLQWNHPKKVESRSFAFELIKPYTTPQFKNSPLNGYHPRRVVGVSIRKRISFQERAVKLPGKYRVVPQQSPGPHRTSTVARRTTSKATAQTSHLARCSDVGSQPPRGASLSNVQNPWSWHSIVLVGEYVRLLKMDWNNIIRENICR